MTVDPTTPTPTAASEPPGLKSSALGQDAFLKLLITQLEHQDPTAPQSDAEFIAQLAQFTSVEKLTSMEKSLSSIVDLLSSPGAAARAASPGSARAQDPVSAPKGTN